ncbi:MAG TPA: xylanase [Candidatus Jeotgalibaca pullicola]|nr:xylanase [Candidatus Jeotgalibaca pullicola]
MNKKEFLIIPIILISSIAGGCSSNEESAAVKDDTNLEEAVETATVKIDLEETFQTVESIGASGAWWSQDIGGWTEEETSELSKREFIAQLLFDQKDGIGLTSYRYNLGAGSTLENSPKIEDPWRRAESFEEEPGTYNWANDENAQWMLKKAVEYGLDDIYLFVNSPLTRLTKNGSAYGDMIEEQSSNLASENYQSFANYVYDVTEYFLQEEIPVTHVSPINEPQWDWTGGQEGNHYEPEEMVALLEVFIDEKNRRPDLEKVALSMPELGEWANSSNEYFNKIIESDILMDNFDTWEAHSYWSNYIAKTDFKKWLDEKELDITLKMSEWTEMVNGRDYTMDSALTLANEIHDDMTILNVIAWQYWIAVSSYDYRDGLIYVDLDTKEIIPTKRLWGMGNFSKFIRPGYTRVSSISEDKELNTISFLGTNERDEKEIIIVIINNGFFEKEIDIEGIEFEDIISYTTDSEMDLEEQAIDNQGIIVPRQSIVTLKILNTNTK